MVESSESFTFRVRRVPASLTRQNLAAYLSGSVSELGLPENIRVRSIAPTPDDWNLPRKQTATIEFSQVPVCLQDERKREILFSVEGSDDTLLFDKAFLAFTPMNSVDRHDFDCIAISGLASHPFGSWRQKGSQQQQFMWLRDQLPNDFKHMRIMTYGYDTALLDSESLQDIDDLARTFITHLKAIGRAEISAKPLVLLAHSLGGIIVKRALSYLAASGEAENFMLSKVKLLLCFGVPNRGMHIEHLLAMTKGRPNDIIVNSLSTASPYLEQIDKSFSGIAIHRSIRLVSAYETVKSPIASLNSSDQWERTGPPEYLVTRASAILSGSRDPEDIVHINRDHSDMVKFAPDDPDYSSVRQFILETVGLVRAPDLDASHNDTGAATSASSPSPNLPLPFGRDNTASTSPWAVDDYGTSSEVENFSDQRDISIPNAVPDNEEALQVRAYTSDLAEPDTRSVLLAKLDFKDRTNRLTSIEVAEKATFGWIFTDKSIGFMDWLFNRDVLFWIRGKPGSGKSTLMRYLHDHAAVRDALQHRNSTRKQISLWFFFNDRGSYLEKSLDGLLRSILFQLQDQERVLFTTIFQAQNFRLDEHDTAWSTEKLTSMFRAFMLQQIKDIDLNLFLDALDEYHGFPETITRWISDLVFTPPLPRSRTTVKICVSCRPWSIFVKTFRTCSGFVLHEYTTEDIEQYAASRLSLTRSDLSDLQRQGILSMISKRAEGVFLWVKLAVKELSLSSSQMSLVELEKLIWKMPRELEDFYTRTIQRLPQHDRIRAYMLLEIVYRASEIGLESALDADNMYCILACAKGSTFQACKELAARARQNAKKGLGDQLQDLIETSGGLLEIRLESEKLSPRKRLQFMHKTARDFVGTPGFAHTVMQERCLVEYENGYTFLLKWKIATFLWKPILDYFDRDCCSIPLLAHMDEKMSGRPSTTFIDSIPQVCFLQLNLSWICKFDEQHWKVQQGLVIQYYEDLIPTSCLSFSFAVNGNLQLYVRSVLSVTDRALVVSKLGSQPLLMNAVMLTAALVMLSPPQYLLSYGLNTCKMFELLFEYGFRDDWRCDGLNAFGLCALLSRRFSGRGSDAAVATLARTLMKIGEQDPDEVFHFKTIAAGYKGAAIHVSGYSMTDMLLKSGANVNLLDGDNNTALDVSLEVFTSSTRFRAKRSLSFDSAPVLTCGLLLTKEKISLLLYYGGTITSKHTNKTAKYARVASECIDLSDAEALRNLKPLEGIVGHHKNPAKDSLARMSWSKLARRLRLPSSPRT